MFVFSLAFQTPSLAGIFATALGIWTIHQFYSPAESSTLPTLVPADRLTEAQALSNLALVIAQGVGLIVLAPLLLKTAGPQYLFRHLRRSVPDRRIPGYSAAPAADLSP